MTWAKLDDGLWCHPKFLGLSMAARGAWCTVLSWSAKHLRDGEVPRALPKALGIDDSLVVELVAAGLWDESKGGWEVHNYLQYNPSKDEVMQLRDSGKARAAQSRDRRKGARRYDRSPERAASRSHVGSATPDPVPVSSLLSVPSELSSAVAALPAMKPPVAQAAPIAVAGRASRLIQEATLVEWHPVGKKWRPALEALGAKPDAEWKLATEVLRREAQKPGVARDVLNPVHVLDYWDSHYARGEAPGQRQPLIKIAANGGSNTNYRAL